MSKSTDLLLATIFTAVSVCLLAESFTEPGIYIVNGWNKPCTIKKWDQLNDSLPPQSCNEQILDASFFIKRLGRTVISRPASRQKYNLAAQNENEAANLRNTDQENPELEAKTAETNDFTKESFYLSGEGLGLVDSITKNYNEAFIVTFNGFIKDFFKETDKKHWAQSLSLYLKTQRKISPELFSRVSSILYKLLPENQDWCNIIMGGKFNYYIITVHEIESQAKKISDPDKFKSWAEGYFTFINGSDNYDSYSVSALKKLIEELIQSKGGSLK